MAEISIIIPVYNSEKYLSRCIDSVLAQEFTNFECILVNDGSTDNSGDICNEYALKDSRIKVIHNKNEGVSSARNIGIKKSKGKYITFIDSDDDIRYDYLQLLIEGAKTGADLVTADVERIISDSKTIERKREYYGEFCAGNLNFYEFVIGGMIKSCQMRSAWNKLYKKSIIISNNILFEEKRPLFEDGAFVLEYISHINKINSMSEMIYRYYENQGSASNSYNENCNMYVYDIIRRLKDFVANDGNKILTNQLQTVINNDFMYLIHYYIMKSPNLNKCIENIQRTIEIFGDSIQLESLTNLCKEIEYLKLKKYRKFVKEYKTKLGYTKMNALKVKVKKTLHIME